MVMDDPLAVTEGYLQYITKVKIRKASAATGRERGRLVQMKCGTKTTPLTTFIIPLLALVPLEMLMQLGSWDGDIIYI